MNQPMPAMLSVSQFAERTGLKPNEVMYRIKKAKNPIQAQKVGWVWIIPESEVDRVKAELKRARKRK